MKRKKKSVDLDHAEVVETADWANDKEFKMKQTVIVDFDGVIHHYTSPWVNALTIVDGPTPGTKEAIAQMREQYQVVVVSSRCTEPGGVEAIQAWLAQHDIVVDGVSATKPPHIVVIDDRALRFEGNWTATLARIPIASKPWNKAK